MWPHRGLRPPEVRGRSPGITKDAVSLHLVHGHGGERGIRGLQRGQETPVVNCQREGVHGLFQQFRRDLFAVIRAVFAGDAHV